jgi:hypothetical protein
VFERIMDLSGQLGDTRSELISLVGLFTVAFVQGPAGPGSSSGSTPDPANAAKIKDWAVRYREALHPTSAGGGYMNFMMDEGNAGVRAAYGGNYDRLARIKAAYDPGNFFRINQNVAPAG